MTETLVQDLKCVLLACESSLPFRLSFKFSESRGSCYLALAVALALAGLGWFCVQHLELLQLGQEGDAELHLRHGVS